MSLTPPTKTCYRLRVERHAGLRIYTVTRQVCLVTDQARFVERLAMRTRRRVTEVEVGRRRGKGTKMLSHRLRKRIRAHEEKRDPAQTP